MTTTECKLFKRIEIAIKITAAKSSGYEAAVANTWNVIRATCEEFEQRLAEAEAKYKDAMADLILRNTDLKVAHDQVTQLRARCGELERIAHKANAVNAHWNEFGHEHGFDERMDHLHSALTATPQPAQEQKS